jgi:DNA replication protein DnaC
MGRYTKSDTFDLLIKLNKHIFNVEKYRKNIIIIGDSGAGKTQLLTKLSIDL